MGVTWKFQHSLRSSGDQRVCELIMGEGCRVEPSEDGDSNMGARTSLSGTPPRGAKRLMSRTNSAPAGGSSSTRLQQRASSRGSLHNGSIDLPPIEVPPVIADKWGAES